MTDDFWRGWQEAVSKTSLEAQYAQLESTGRLENFRRAATRQPGTFEGYCFNDSDVYKWLEAAAYGMLTSPTDGLRTKIDSTIELIAAAQQADGYLDTYFQIAHPELKWRNLGSMHEMYCAGHLLEAAVALKDCVGDERLLNVAVRLSDNIAARFGPDKQLGYPGHEEIEVGLLRLADATGDHSYRELATWMIEVRGSRPSPLEAELADNEAQSISPHARRMLTKEGKYSGEYLQDHLPIREHAQVVGHAVRAMYLYTAAAEIADESMLAALQATWDNLVKRRMYVTGGIGPSGENEGFTTDFDLPNATAYAETCASCGLVFWADAMLRRTAKAQYAEVLERALYNGAIAGMSLTGDSFFYANPLEGRGNYERSAWFECACCPPNIARMIGRVGQYVAGYSSDAFYLHIPAGFEAACPIGDTPVQFSIESDYPWSGRIKVRVEPERPVEFAVHVRIPDWAEDVETDLPGQENESEFEHGYAVFRKTWKKGDVLTVDFGMAPKWVESDPRVRDNLGRVALTRGPLVYCAESPDIGVAPQLLIVDPEAPVTEMRVRHLGGIVTLGAPALADVEEFSDDLYGNYGTTQTVECEATFIPYYAWANRGPSYMAVWLRRA